MNMISVTFQSFHKLSMSQSGIERISVTFQDFHKIIISQHGM